MMSISTRMSMGARLRVAAFLVLAVLGVSRHAHAQTPAQTVLLDQTVAVPNGWGGVVFTAPTFDTGNFWSASTPDRLIARTGMTHLQVTASVGLGADCTVCVIYIVKNGSEYVAQSYGATANTGFGGAWFTAVAPAVPVSPGDYFTVVTYQNTGAVANTTMRFSATAIPATPSDGLPKAVRLQGTPSAPDGWSGNLSLGPASFDTGSMWSSGTPTRVTIPSGVQYVQVAAQASFDWACTVCSVYVLRNDTDLVAFAYGSTANTGFGGTWSTAFAPVTKVAPGDYLTVRVYQNTGAALAVPIDVSVADLGTFGGSGTLKTAHLREVTTVPDLWGGNISFAGTFGGSAFDTAGLWSNTHPDRLTVPANVGHVQVGASTGFSADCSVCVVYIVKNDVTIVAWAYGATANTGFGGAWYTAYAPVVPVQPGDYFTVRAFQNTGAPVDTEVRFMMTALGPPLGPGPTLMTLTPGTAAAGQSVTLTGLHFGASQGPSTVRFPAVVGSADAVVTAWSDTSISAVVPPTAISGTVTVRVAGQDSNGKAFTLIPPPAIASVIPSWGIAGDSIVISGANFGTAGTVTFANNKAGVVTAWSASSITVTVPTGAVTGELKVAVTATGLSSNLIPFTVGSEEVLYYHTDPLGSVRLISGAAGLTLERHDYLPFGEEWPPLTNQAHIGFGGKEKDPETGNGSWSALNYSGARYYTGQTGRFTSVDPFLDITKNVADPQQWNRYTYARNNPLLFIDPSGLDCVYVNSTKDGIDSISPDGNSDDCGSTGGTWIPGTVSGALFNRSTGLFQVASIDGSNVYYATFGGDARTDASGKCVSGCPGADIQHADASWLRRMAESQGGSLDGMITFMVNRVQPLEGGLFNQIASGPLAFWNNNWAGPGGMGPPHGRGDWAAMAHDYAFMLNGIGIGTYFNPTIPPEKAGALIRANHMLIGNAGGVQAVKMGVVFGVVNAFQWLNSRR